MAKLTVPPLLRDKLGDDASAALIDLLHEAQNGQRQLLLQSVEDRFLRHVAESEGRLRSEMQAGFLELQRQMGALRADVSKEIADLRKEFTGEIAGVRKEFTGEISQSTQGIHQAKSPICAENSPRKSPTYARKSARCARKLLRRPAGS